MFFVLFPFVRAIIRCWYWKHRALYVT